MNGVLFQHHSPWCEFVMRAPSGLSREGLQRVELCGKLGIHQSAAWHPDFLHVKPRRDFKQRNGGEGKASRWTLWRVNFFGRQSDFLKEHTVDGQHIQTSRKRLDWHPLPQMSKFHNVCVTCHAVGFDLFCPPISTLGRRKRLWNWAAGDKVGQGLNDLSIYGMLNICSFKLLSWQIPL